MLSVPIRPISHPSWVHYLALLARHLIAIRKIHLKTIPPDKGHLCKMTHGVWIPWPGLDPLAVAFNLEDRLWCNTVYNVAATPEEFAICCNFLWGGRGVGNPGFSEKWKSWRCTYIIARLCLGNESFLFQNKSIKARLVEAWHNKWQYWIRSVKNLSRVIGLYELSINNAFLLCVSVPYYIHFAPYGIHIGDVSSIWKLEICAG